MNNVLKNVLRFTGLVVGVPSSQPHLLNVNEVPVIPQLVGASASGFTVTADAINVTVTRDVPALSGDVDVYVEHWHTIEAVLPPGGLGTLVPFIFSAGGAGGGGGITQLTNDVAAGPGSGSQAASVVGLQGNPVSPVAPLNGQILTWNGGTSEWEPQTPSPDAGITQLTSDVTAGPGSGSQIATVVGLQGNPVSPLAPGMSSVLTWNGAAWVPSPLPAVGSLPRLGNTLVVDAVNGNDGTGAVNGLPFLTVEGAISYINLFALTNVTIWILPGTYALSAGITIPATCSLRGLSTQTTRITLAASNPGGTVTMITMGANTRIEDLSLTLTSTDPTTSLVGINTPGSTSITSKLRTAVLTVDNRTVPTGSTTNVYGILDNGTGALGPASFSFNFTRGVTINVYSNGGGNKRAVLVATANDISFRDTNFYVAAPTDAASTGSYVGVETTNNNASAEFRASSIRGAPTAGSYTGSDILQTLPLVGATPGLGIQVGPGCDLVSRTAGGRAMTTFITPSTLVYSLRGNAPNLSRYFWLGNQTTLDATEVFYRFQQRAVMFGMFVNMRTAPGLGASLQFVVKKSSVSTPGSGVATVMTATVSGVALTASKYDASVDFGIGEYLSVEVIPSGGNTAADIVVELDIF